MGSLLHPSAPTRKGLAIASLIIGILGVPTLGCLGLGALLSTVLGIVALVRAGRAPREYGGRGFAIGGIVASALSLVVAAIAIPSLLPARRSANESATIGDVRSVISAEAAYQSANCGTYGRLECLSNPQGPGCIVGYPATAPTFLDSMLTSAQVKSGYRRTFHPGTEKALSAGPGCPGGTGLESFAYTAEPATRGQTGVRGFCGDDTGFICFTSDGRTPLVTNGRCAKSCTPLN